MAVKPAEKQGRAVALRTHRCFVRQRTQLINASCRRHAFGVTLGLVARQRSTGGNARLGAVSKMGQTDIRRLLIVGAPLGSMLRMRLPGSASRQHATHAPAGQCMSVIRWVVRKGGSANRWLAALVARKPKMVAAVALANEMARMIWAVTTKQEDCKMA